MGLFDITMFKVKQLGLFFFAKRQSKLYDREKSILHLKNTTAC